RKNGCRSMAVFNAISNARRSNCPENTVRKNIRFGYDGRSLSSINSSIVVRGIGRTVEALLLSNKGLIASLAGGTLVMARAGLRFLATVVGANPAVSDMSVMAASSSVGRLLQRLEQHLGQHRTIGSDSNHKNAEYPNRSMYQPQRRFT